MLEKSEAVNVHGWITPNNEHMYDFFARHFGLANANKTEMDLAPLSCDVLMATSTGQIATDPALSASARFMHDLVADITSANIEKIEVGVGGGWELFFGASFKFQILPNRQSAQRMRAASWRALARRRAV